MTNSGTSSAAVFNFGIPQGAAGTGSGGGVNTVNTISPVNGDVTLLGSDIQTSTLETASVASRIGTALSDAAAAQSTANTASTTSIAAATAASQALTAANNAITSDGEAVSGTTTGNDSISNVIKLTQSQYDNLDSVSTDTLYVIVG